MSGLAPADVVQTGASLQFSYTSRPWRSLLPASAQLQFGPHAQLFPHEWREDGAGLTVIVQAQTGPQVQGWQLHCSVIGTSRVSGLDDRVCRRGARRTLEWNGYVIRRLAGGTPNMRRKVRLKCAESANPASCAACVSEDPAANLSTERISLSHKR